MSRPNGTLRTVALAVATTLGAQLSQATQWPGSAPVAARAPRAAAAVPGLQAGATYDYTLDDGQMVTLDFPLFTDSATRRVTKDVFRGYALYNSYCYRCHGTDATESQLGPNLRRSLETGMTAAQFLAVAMPGREDQGMPGWAGFLSEEEMTSIYRYVKGRSVGLLPVGRPPSEYE